MKRQELYFGLNIGSTGRVTDEEFNQFVKSTVSPAFPNGITVIDAKGQWLSPVDGLVKEDSKVIILLHEGDSETDKAIQEIREAYKTLFKQDSVMLLTFPSIDVSF